MLSFLKINFQYFTYTVTLDYKGLVLIMCKITDEDFLLGGQGLCVEFCIFCLALRVSESFSELKTIML